MEVFDLCCVFVGRTLALPLDGGKNGLNSVSMWAIRASRPWAAAS